MDELMDEHNDSTAVGPGVVAVVELSDRLDLFDVLDNEHVVALSQLSQGTGFDSVASVLKSTGIRTRRILRPGVTPLAIAIQVLERLIEATGMARLERCAVLIAHSHVDSSAGSTLARQLREAAGFLLPPDCEVVGYNFGCSGYIRLLQEASVCFESDPSLQYVVLLNVETPELWHDGADRAFCGLVSAAGTGTLLQRGAGMPIDTARADDFPVPAGLRLNPRPLFHQELCEAYTFRGEPVRRRVMRMNPEPVFLGGIELMLDNLRAAIACVDLSQQDRLIVVPHQPSGKLLRAFIAAARVEWPQVHCLCNLLDHGNSISATIPTILARLPDVVEANGFPPLRDGEPFVLLAAGIRMADMADEMSAGFACLRYQLCGRVEPAEQNSRRHRATRR